ncbi:hypothetical protein MC885_001848 [Smutsia gigantea]|nr:hypothetical protein MC885_001848 [Smutsia gigantea]
MTRARGLGLLLALVLPMVSASRPGAVALWVTVPYFLDRNGEVIQPTRVQILNVSVPHLRLKLIAGLGVRLVAEANFTFQVFRAPEPLELTLPVMLLADARVAQGSIGTPVVSISACLSLFGDAILLDGSNSTAPALLVPVHEHIKAVLRDKVCLSVSNLVQYLNVHLATLIESQIRYSMISAPNITNDYISLDINTVLFLLGQPVALPADAAPFALPEHVGSDGAMATVGLSQGLFASALLLLQKAGSLNLDVTGQLKSDDNPLNTSVLGQHIPEVARQFPEPMPVVLKVRLSATPVATLHAGNATLRLQPFVEAVNLSLQLSVSKVKLQGYTTVLGDIQHTVASSNVGFIDTNQMHILMGSLFEKPLLDHLNALLGMGVALPNILNLHYVSPEVFVCEGYVVISSGLFFQH